MYNKIIFIIIVFYIFFVSVYTIIFLNIIGIEWAYYVKNNEDNSKE